MPKVSAKQVQRRIVALDAQYTVAQPKRPGRRALAVIILAIIALAAFSSAHRTSSDFSRLHTETWPYSGCHVGSSLNPIQTQRMRVMDTLKGAALVITLFAFIATCATVRKQERIAR